MAGSRKAHAIDIVSADYYYGRPLLRSFLIWERVSDHCLWPVDGRTVGFSGRSEQQVRAKKVFPGAGRCRTAIVTVGKINHQTGMCPLRTERYYLERGRVFNERRERERAAC